MSGEIPQADGHAPPQVETSSRPKVSIDTAEIDSTIIHPGSVKINVQGAFIVDQDATTPNGSGTSPYLGCHDTKDIRLPNHTAVVSHVAVDVRRPHPPISKIEASLICV
jgi:type II pantothenate kinase